MFPNNILGDGLNIDRKEIQKQNKFKNSEIQRIQKFKNRNSRTSKRLLEHKVTGTRILANAS